MGCASDEPAKKKKKCATHTNKVHNIKFDAIPNINSIHEMVGKRVAHFVCEKSKYKWFYGTIIMLSEHDENDLIIKYGGFKTYYCVAYKEYKEFGTLKLINLEIDHILQKYVLQTFKDPKGITEWQEYGIISDYDAATGLLCVKYFKSSNLDLEEIYEQIVMTFEEILSEYLLHHFTLFELQE